MITCKLETEERTRIFLEMLKKTQAVSRLFCRITPTFALLYQYRTNPGLRVFWGGSLYFSAPSVSLRGCKCSNPATLVLRSGVSWCLVIALYWCEIACLLHTRCLPVCLSSCLSFVSFVHIHPHMLPSGHTKEYRDMRAHSYL